MKYVINNCFGGFGLSQEAYKWLIDNKNWKVKEIENSSNFYHKDALALIDQGYSLYESKGTSLTGPIYLLVEESDLKFRSNPDVVECVETLGKKSWGMCAKLKIVNANMNPECLEIDEYDGLEELQTIPTRFN